jgi:hypothetical protein
MKKIYAYEIERLARHGKRYGICIGKTGPSTKEIDIKKTEQEIGQLDPS